MENSKSFRQRVAAYGNPYRFLDLEEDEDVAPPADLPLQQKRAGLRRMENPYAWHAAFDEESPEATSSPNGQRSLKDVVGASDTILSGKALESLLDEVLGQYKPYIARNEWVKVVEFRSEFLEEAKADPALTKRVAKRLEQLRFTLMPGEKVEYNRAPAERIIAELKRLLE
jgi:hypothetical protein